MSIPIPVTKAEQLHEVYIGSSTVCMNEELLNRRLYNLRFFRWFVSLQTDHSVTNSHSRGYMHPTTKTQLLDQRKKVLTRIVLFAFMQHTNCLVE